MKQHSIISKLQLILPLLIIFICALGFLFAPNDPDLVDMTIKFLPVSYTHLDVYKRQAQWI